MQQLEAALWDISREGHQDGLNCNTGKQPCAGKPGKMALLEPGQADLQNVKKILGASIVPMWVEDCSKFSKTCGDDWYRTIRSEEHTSELQSLMRISYAVFCLKKKKQTTNTIASLS